jgi:hypothetical protein
MPPSPASARQPLRGRSIATRREARQEKIARENQIVMLLNRGAAVAEIAAREGVSLNHMRNVVRNILARRAPAPPAEFLALQVSRLNEALLVSYDAMYNRTEGANFEAVDRIVKIVRELDRYHGFAAPSAPRGEPVPRRLPPPANLPLVVESPMAERIENGAATD